MLACDYLKAASGDFLETFGLNPDLQDLSNSNLAVVCSGIEPRSEQAVSEELLETFGVPFYTMEEGNAI